MYVTIKSRSGCGIENPQSLLKIQKKENIATNFFLTNIIFLIIYNARIDI